MTRLSRRDFVHGGCTLAAASFASNCGNAGLHFHGSLSNNNRVTVNAAADYKNLVKGFALDQDPVVCDSSGYPQSTLSVGLLARASPNMPAGYYGNFVLKWTGTASLFWVTPPLIVISGGLSVGFGSASGDLGPGNKSFTGTTPKITFAVGWSIQSISAGASNGLGGNLIRINTLTNNVASGSGYTIGGNLVNIAGAATNTGANGTWTITNLAASSFDLAGTTFTNSGGVQGQALFQTMNNSISLPSGFAFSTFSALVWCRAADETDIGNGIQISDDLISLYQYLGNGAADLGSRAWSRFMDYSGAQGSWERDFAQRMPVSQICYAANYIPSGYRVGNITNTSDAYACSNPSASGAGAYVDGEIVMGKIVGANTAGNPTLNVNSRGAKPIYWHDTSAWPFQIKFSGPPTTPGTDVLKFTFTATWLNGGTPYVLTYNTVVGDTTAGALMTSVATAINADATLSAAKIVSGTAFFAIPGAPVIVRTAQAGRMTLTYTSGPAVVTIQGIDPAAIVNGNQGTFVYNYLLDGFIYFAAIPVFSAPYELIVEFCNRTGTHCWFNFGFTSAANVAAVASFFGDATTGLTQGLKWGWEPWNEVWNGAAFPGPIMGTLGVALGFGVAGNEHLYGYTGARVRQQAPLTKAAWIAKGRNASDHYVLCPTQLGEGIGANFDQFQARGINLKAASTIWMTYGGLNGGAAADYTAAGNRSVDFMDAFGCAPYINSRWWGSGSFTNATQVTGTAASNAPWLQAALDYKHGLTSTAFTSLVNQFTRVTDRGIGNGASDFVDMQGFFNQQETMAAQYDSFRASQSQRKLSIMHYEGAFAFGIGADGNSGVNSVNSGDVAALANQMTSLGWNVSTWTFSGTDDKTEMATMVFTMSQAWKFDVSYKNVMKTFYYQALKNTNPARETHGAQFGIDQGNWSIFPISFRTLPAYTTRDAIHEFNA